MSRMAFYLPNETAEAGEGSQFATWMVMALCLDVDVLLLVA